ncbi:MAG: hypothetical protein V1800_02570 [Candidatus Latescibacterota bacterium]
MKKNTIIGIASITLGGIIYVLWRKQTLLMFSWFDSMGLNSTIALLRDSASACSSVIPEWLCFSLPNALWAFGGILLFSSIWKHFFAERLFWVLIFSITAIGSEIGQLVGIVPGTYDTNDIALMLIFIFLAILISNTRAMKEVNDAEGA